MSDNYNDYKSYPGGAPQQQPRPMYPPQQPYQQTYQPQTYPPQPPKKSGHGGLIAAVIAAGVLLLAAVIVLAVLLVRLSGDHAEQTVQTAAPADTAGPETTETRDYAGLVVTESETTIPNSYEDLDYIVPRIVWEGNVIDDINAYISDYCYPRIEASQSEYDSDGYVYTSGGMHYEWWVNDDILTLILWDYVYPDASGWDEPQIWNVDLSDADNPRELTKADILEYFGLAQDEYITLTQDALGSCFCERYEGAFESGMGLDTDFTHQQFERTIAAENAEAAEPYIGENGSLWVNASIYSLAGGELYPGQADVLDTDYAESYLDYIGG